MGRTMGGTMGGIVGEEISFGSSCTELLRSISIRAEFQNNVDVRVEM
jgi:hypothetical protein